MPFTLAHPSFRSINVRQAPWGGEPGKPPRGSPAIPTHVPITILSEQPDCMLVTDGKTTGWVKRLYVKLIRTHDRLGQSGHEKTKLRVIPSRKGDYVLPIVELTKGMNVALLDGRNGMSLVSAIVDGVVCIGWVQTSYLH
jgi:hypothetical protein